MTPRLDVVIPVLDGRRHIGAAVASVLAQVGVDARAIVVDAGSTDGTVAEVASWDDPRVTLISGRGRLMTGAARNAGAAVAEAPWLAFLDADDLWPVASSRELLAAISDPARQLAVGHMVTFPGDAEIDLSAPWPVTGHPPALVAGGTLLSRTVFDTVGPFDPELRVGEFIEWLSRARMAGIDEVPVPVVSLLRRSHEHNTSRTRKDDYAVDVLTIVRRQRARQRAIEEARRGSA